MEKEQHEELRDQVSPAASSRAPFFFLDNAKNKTKWKKKQKLEVFLNLSVSGCVHILAVQNNPSKVITELK